VIATIKPSSNGHHMFADVISGFLGTLLAAAVFFLLKEYVFTIPKFSGMFYLKSMTEGSKRNPYVGLTVYHTLVLYSDGVSVEGSSEKTGEINNIGEGLPYYGEHRRRGKVSGRIQRNYFKPSTLNLHIEEDGELRVSSIYIGFKVTRETILDGYFRSTAADSSGITLWFDQPLPEHPTRP
jgi:hypothetical protein